MKKRIVALIGALTLTFAMSLNVFAEGSSSVNADDVAAAANEQLKAVEDAKVELAEGGSSVTVTVGDVAVDVPMDYDSTIASLDKADAAMREAWDDDCTDGMALDYITSVDEGVKIAVALAKNLSTTTNVKKAETLATIVINKPEGVKEATIAFGLEKLGAGNFDPSKEQIWAVNGRTGAKIIGVVTGGKVKFTSSEFSPYAIVRVAMKEQAASQPPYNPDWDPAVQAERQAAAQAQHEAAWAAYLANGGTLTVVATAPKTGDVVAMISIMAVIFLGGAVTAVAMSKKRA